MGITVVMPSTSVGSEYGKSENRSCEIPGPVGFTVNPYVYGTFGADDTSTQGTTPLISIYDGKVETNPWGTPTVDSPSRSTANNSPGLSPPISQEQFVTLSLSLDTNRDGQISKSDFSTKSSEEDKNSTVLVAAQDSFGTASVGLEIPGIADAEKTFTFSNVLKWQSYFDGKAQNAEGANVPFDESASVQQWGVGGKVGLNLDALNPDNSTKTK